MAKPKGTLAKDQHRAKSDADEKRAVDLFNKKVISDQERDTAIAAAGSSRANVEADEAAVKQAESTLATPDHFTDRRRCRHCYRASRRPGRSEHGSLTSVSQLDPIKAVVTAGEGPFTDFISRHPIPMNAALC
jgi:hypothetical protein